MVSGIVNSNWQTRVETFTPPETDSSLLGFPCKYVTFLSYARHIGVLPLPVECVK